MGRPRERLAGRGAHHLFVCSSRSSDLPASLLFQEQENGSDCCRKETVATDRIGFERTPIEWQENPLREHKPKQHPLS